MPNDDSHMMSDIQEKHVKSPEETKEKKELIEKFGNDRGKKLYGAIKELEEFLDPQVMRDEDF